MIFKKTFQEDSPQQNFVIHIKIIQHIFEGSMKLTRNSKFLSQVKKNFPKLFFQSKRNKKWWIKVFFIAWKKTEISPQKIDELN